MPANEESRVRYSDLEIPSFPFLKIFQPLETHFSMQNAFCLACCAQLAYQEPEVIKNRVIEWGFTEFEFYDREGTQAFLAANDETIIVAFRGTEPPILADWMTDFDFKQVPGPAGKVHAGFAKALSIVWRRILKKIISIRSASAVDLQTMQRGDGKKAGPANRNVPTLWITGHSLGAALALLATAELKLREDRPVRGLYTFGQPRAGNQDFAHAFNSVFKERTYRFANNNDVVTRVAPRLLGYSHTGSIYYIEHDGKIRPDINRWEQFLDRLQGRFDDFLDVMHGNLIPDGIEDHNMVKGYIPAIKKNLETEIQEMIQNAA
ncbi:MAG: lipase [Nitrospinae bacterium CG11_big_fil_rev_8_21_14_0_20_45_15]|nr:MAG: lipase [Nitrospinae bacterium CG11_big_fil_rev_8_21_14_0_20_45_15]